jgi:stress-induced morphogen
MAMQAEEIKNYILQALPDAEIEITDLKGDGEHYSAHICSKAFIGKRSVQQHQMVYEALQGKMGTELHALALKTTTPDM